MDINLEDVFEIFEEPEHSKNVLLIFRKNIILIQKSSICSINRMELIMKNYLLQKKTLNHGFTILLSLKKMVAIPGN